MNLLSLALSLSLSANPGYLSLELGDSSRLWIEGDSTLHRYTMTADKFFVQTSLGPLPEGLEPGLAKAWEAYVAGDTHAQLDLGVPVLFLKSGKDGMDKKALKALKSEDHPSIRFVLDHCHVEGAQNPEESPSAVNHYVIHGKGKLTVAGVTKEVNIKALAGLSPEGELTLSGSAQVKMSDFGVKKPSAMLGAIKTSNEVDVMFEFVFAAPIR